MNLLYFTYTLPKPSSPYRGTFILRRIEELINQGMNLTVVTTEHIFNILKYKKIYNFQDLNYEVNQDVRSLLKIENPYTYTNLLKKNNIKELENIINENKIDLIHAHFVRDGLLALKLKETMGLPYILTLHGSDITIGPFKSKKVFHLTQNVLNNSDYNIFVSKSLLKISIDKLKNVNKNNIFIPNGYSPRIFKPFNLDQKNQQIYTIGFCGYLIKIKRADKFPYIYHLIHSKLPNSKFVIIGSGPLKRQMINEFIKYKLLDKVEFKGSMTQQKIAEEMNKMNILILPSINEGFPTVIPEAMACGLQVVASNANGSPEAVANAGFIVDQDKSDFEKRFAEQVVYALINPIPKDVVLERAKELTWENIVKKEIEVYRIVLNDRNI